MIWILAADLDKSQSRVVKEYTEMIFRGRMSYTCMADDQAGFDGGIDAVPLFAGARPLFVDGLASAGRRHDLGRGHVIFMQDDPADWFYVIHSGWVKLYRQTLDGDEVILDVLPSGAVFGETGVFDDPVYTFSAEVAQDACIHAYPLALLRQEVAANQDFAMALLRHVVQGQRDRDKEIEHRTIQNAPQRLGCFLLRLIPARQEGSVTLHLPYDKTLIAARLGMQSETFSRALARLRADLGLKVRGASIDIPSMDALISYTCSACSNAYPCSD